jgi:hypothetical protein
VSIGLISTVHSSQSHQTPCRAFSLKFARPRFASAAATVRSPPPPQPLGPFPYPSHGIPSNSPPSHVKLKAEQDKAKSEEVEVKDSTPLPQASFDERRVAVGWDASTWSRLCVRLTSLVDTGLMVRVIKVITSGYATIAVVKNASIRSPSSV